MNDRISSAQALYLKGKIKLALKEYLSILQQKPQSALAYQGLAQCRYALKQYEAAVDASKKALEIDPGLYFPHVVLAYTYWGYKQFNDCETHLKLAIMNSPKSIEPYLALSSLLMKEKRFDESEDILRKVIDLDSQNWEAPLRLADVFIHKSRLQDAMRNFKRSFFLRPSISTAFRIFSLLISKVIVIFAISFVALIILSLRLPLVYSIPILVLISLLLMFAAISYIQIKRLSTGISAIIFNILIIIVFFLAHR